MSSTEPQMTASSAALSGARLKLPSDRFMTVMPRSSLPATLTPFSNDRLSPLSSLMSSLTAYHAP